MLTYATVQDFLDMKDINKTGIITVSTASTDKISAYLKRATRYIDKMARRRFFPWIETRIYSIPYAAWDLSIRRFPTAHLKLDQDLLEVIVLSTDVAVTAETTLSTANYFLLKNNIYPKTIIAIKFPATWSGALAGNTIPFARFDEPTISLEGVWGYADFDYPRLSWVDTGDVIGAGGITNSQTSIVVSDVGNTDELGEEDFLTGYLIRVENEFMEVTEANTITNTITVIRGVNGTTATAHVVDTQIDRWRVIDDIKEVCLQITKTWREADISVGSRIGVSDYSAGVEINIPNDPIAIIKSYQRSLLFG